MERGCSKMKFIIFVCGCLVDAQFLKSQNQHLDDLLEEPPYDHTMPPSDDRPTNVSVYIRFYNVHSVDEESMDFSSELFVQLKWVDGRLNNDKRFYVVPEYIQKVWRPNVYFSNEKSAKLHDVPQANEAMYIHRKGFIIYNMRLTMKHGCYMTFTWYPFDQQICTVSLMSYMYTTTNVNLYWDPDGIDLPKSKCIHFELKGGNTSQDVLFTKVGDFSRLSFDLILSRRPFYYVLNLYIASVFIVILSWIAFWIDPQIVNGRLSLGSVCVLTMVSNHAGIQNRVPSGDHFKAIDVWTIVCQFFVFSALVEYAIVYYLFVYPAKKAKKTRECAFTTTNMKYGSCKGTQTREIKDKTMDTSFDDLDGLTRSILIDKSTNEKVCENKVGERQTDKRNKIDKCSRWIFPICFLLFIIIYTLVIHSNYQTLDFSQT